MCGSWNPPPRLQSNSVTATTCGVRGLLAQFYKLNWSSEKQNKLVKITQPVNNDFPKQISTINKQERNEACGPGFKSSKSP